jgi:hypothetical protein
VKIFKSVLLRGETILELPAYATILSVKNQRDTLVIYYSIHETCVENREKRKFYAYETGEAFREVTTRNYIGTVIFGMNDSYVLHVYEETTI